MMAYRKQVIDFVYSIGILHGAECRCFRATVMEIDAMHEYLFEGTADGRPVKLRIFAQSSNDAYTRVKAQLGCRSLSILRTTKL